MIYRLRRKFILVSALSLFLVFGAILLVTAVAGRIQLDHTMDVLTDTIGRGDGSFPRFEDRPGRPDRDRMMFGRFGAGEIITEETPFSTRFFTVWLDGEGEVQRINTDFVSSLSEEEVRKYAGSALKKGTERGWISEYRFKKVSSESETMLVFVNGSMNRTMTRRFTLLIALVLLVSSAVILALFILISGRVVRPVSESYEKQKQFITDAGHELKTPLTLILSNAEIALSEVAENEWLEDIRSEGERMSELVREMVTLSKMDEGCGALAVSDFDLSSALGDTVSEFQAYAEERGKRLTSEIRSGLTYRGDEAMIRRLLSILLDNAVKYCDPNGEIKVVLSQKRHPILTVENTCAKVAELETDRFFDRFYRADRARTFDGSFGLGLSIAKAIVRDHRGELTVYKKDRLIGFRAELK